ncbi:hypothetical protein EV204_105245 [Tissierella praeacuta]|uniref:DUF5839 family protein n=1 Tax=Tissierella praeacuta TaxID=43131 RepID=UPI001051607B|nr:DUF5839 family protein [Tissierella praeacuta]TCU72909.1 hypothetical protein EV204_105245 [Tissierella praeacuta]
MKTMTIEELKKRGFKQGDILFINHKNSEFTGWYMAIRENGFIGLNTPVRGSWGTDTHTRQEITKVILREDLSKSHLYITSKFFQSFEESFFKDYITHIKPNIAKYIHAVHFGSTKLYTWRVPKEFADIDFRAGDIVEVDTVKGRQYVEVRETAEYEYDEKTKEITKLIKVFDYYTRRIF